MGGVIACNLSGPRRVRSGSARDYVLGFSAINGFGEIWKAGGKVVKNVTGYDMSKLQAGAYGTLSLLTEMTVKVMPRPETACTILLHGLADEVAIPALAQALNTPFEVSAAAHLPAAVARRSKVGAVAAGLGAVTALRLEGPRPSVVARAEAIEALLGQGARVDEKETGEFWKEIGSVHPLLHAGPRIVWRICPTPSRAPDVLKSVAEEHGSAEAYFDWGGGQIWLSLDAEEAGPRRGRSRRPRRGETGRRIRHAGRRPGSDPRLGPCVRAAKRRSRPAFGARQERVRPAWHPQSRTHAGRAIGPALLKNDSCVDLRFPLILSLSRQGRRNGAAIDATCSLSPCGRGLG